MAKFKIEFNSASCLWGGCETTIEADDRDDAIRKLHEKDPLAKVTKVAKQRSKRKKT